MNLKSSLTFIKFIEDIIKVKTKLKKIIFKLKKQKNYSWIWSIH